MKTIRDCINTLKRSSIETEDSQFTEVTFEVYMAHSNYSLDNNMTFNNTPYMMEVQLVFMVADKNRLYNNYRRF